MESTMQPRAAINDTDRFGVAAGAPVQINAPQFQSDPTLGQRMANRDWARRDEERYYQMRHAPLPTHYSTETPHGHFEPAAANQFTQFLPAVAPPTGYERRGLTQSHVDAGGRGPTTYSFGSRGNARLAPRPSYAFNRVVGQNRIPTMYAWPIQIGPGGSNTYIPSWEATGLLIKYTRQQQYFRINKYLKELTVPLDQGYYLTLSAEDPYRIVSVNDYLWEDSADAPGGRQERMGFGYQIYRTGRYAYPFSLGRKSVQQAEWPVLAEHALQSTCKAMTVRTKLAVTELTLTANYTGPWGTNSATVLGVWTTSSETDLFIQKDINRGMIAIEQATGGIVTDEEGLYFTINPTLARGIATSPEYRNYIKGSPDALSFLTDQRNPNRKYGLAPQLYGLDLVIENAIIITAPKPANVAVASQPAQPRSYIWPTANATITSKPNGIVAPEDQTVDFSTGCFRFFEQMTTEQKSDPDNRREVGRVVEDYVFTLQAPQTGFLFNGAS